MAKRPHLNDDAAREKHVRELNAKADERQAARQAALERLRALESERS